MLKSNGRLKVISAVSLFLMIFFIIGMPSDSFAKPYVTSHDAPCNYPVVVWHQDVLPENMILSYSTKDYPDYSEQWGLRKCKPQLAFIPFAKRGKVRLPDISAKWESSEGTIDKNIWTPELKTRPRIAWIRQIKDDGQMSYTLYGISAPADIPIKATPNTSASVVIGGEKFGPFKTDGSGFVEIRVDIPPTAKYAEIHLTNQLGDVSKSELKLSPNNLVVPYWRTGELGQFLDILTYNPSSRSPIEIKCTGGLTITNNFRTIVIPDEHENLKCKAGNKNIEIPDRPRVVKAAILEINTFPRIMSVDRPQAKVQIRALDHQNQPLDPKGIELKADVGEIKSNVVNSDLLAEYDGVKARLLGGDTLTATWNPPSANTGTPYLACVTYRNDSDRNVKCQVHNETKQPLSGVRVDFSVNEVTLKSLTSDDKGWLNEVAVPDGVEFITATYGEKTRRFHVERTPTVKQPKVNVLERRQHLIITKGAVREIRIETSQMVHELSSTRQTEVRVELYDVSGNVVTDEEVFVQVSDGTITEPQKTPNGAYVSRYLPSGNIQFGTVKITASTLSGAYTASTSLQITPDEMHGAIGLSAGALTLTQQPLRLNTRFLYIQKTPVSDRLFGLFSIERTAIQSYDSGYRVQQNMIPVNFGLSYRSSVRRLNSYLDASLAINPYRLNIRYTESSILDQWGISYPGFQIGTGLRYRSTFGEALFGARFISIPFSSQSLGWNQQFTGILFEAGYLWSY